MVRCAVTHITHEMPEPLSILGAVGASIALTKELIKAIDFIIGAYTKNTPTAASWFDLLSKLKTELLHARDQLNLVRGEIEPMRVKQGPGADAANLKRKEVAFDELLRELANQLKASEEQFRNATDEFNQNGLFDWVLLGSLDTRAREAVAPIELHTQKLNETRRRVHDARNVIIDAFLAHCYNHAGDRFPTLESLGGIRDRLALDFLSPDEPFCHKADAQGSLTSGLLICNRSDSTLQELHARIQVMGAHWVHGAPRKAENQTSESPTPTLDILEECQKIMLTQLDKGTFDAIINSDSPFTDRTRAIRGRCIVQEWRSILLGGGGGVMIAFGGKVSAGKSSIINAMLGRPLLPTASMSLAQWKCKS